MNLRFWRKPVPAQKSALTQWEGAITSTDAWRTYYLDAPRELRRQELDLAQAYMTCVWAYAALNKRAQKVAELLTDAEVIDTRTGEPVENSAFEEALALSYREYRANVWLRWQYDLCLYGEAYIEKVYSFPFGTYRLPATLKIINALDIEPHVTAGKVTGYRYNGQEGGRILDADDVVFDRMFNPLDDVRGYSMLAVAIDAVNVDRYAGQYAQNFFKNNAHLGTVFTLKEGASLTEPDYNRVKSMLESYSKGVQNAFRAFFMPAQVDVTTTSVPAMDAQDILTDQQKRKICAALGVPVALVDFGDARFQLSDEQRRGFYQETVIPECKRVIEIANADLLPFFDPTRRTKLKLNTESVSYLLEDETKKITNAKAKLESGGYTLNEYRAELGSAEVVGGDLFLFPAGVIPIPASALMNAPALVSATTAPPMGFSVSPPPEPPPLLPAGNSKQTSPDDELKAWHKHALNKGALKSALSFNAMLTDPLLAAWIREELSAPEMLKADIHALFDDVEVIRGLKTYATTRASYQGEIRGAITAARADEVTRRRFGGSMRTITRRAGLQAIYDAFEQADNPIESIPTPMLTMFRAWELETSGYITNFGEELFKEGGIPEEAVDTRVAMWANKTLDDLFYTALREAAPSLLATWRYDPDKEHCDTCLQRQGETRSIDQWGKIGFPRDRRLDCGGWLCGCELYDQRGQRFGVR